MNTRLKIGTVIIMQEITINKNDSGQRLDKFLTKFMPKLPKSMLYKGLRKKCVRINGKHAKDGSVFLKEGDILKLYFGDEFFSPQKSFSPIAHKLDTVYEDENLIIVNKPSGVVVHTDDKDTKHTLILEIQSYLYDKGEYRPDTEKSFAPALCNRLDRNTSGLIIAAKNAEALRIINEKIRNREIRKFYTCICEGHMKKSGTLSAFLTRLDKKVEISNTPTENSKPVKLTYSVIGENEKHSLVEIELLTGRTHQIRAQFSHIGHPLVGDVKYGGSRSEKYQELVSRRLMFDFKSDAGILNYMIGADFSVPTEFSETFAHTS